MSGKTNTSGDLYSVLQVTSRAEPEVVEAAYRALMKKYAPRLPTDNDEQAKVINNAHDVIGNPDKRRAYDGSRSSVSGIVVGNYRILEPIAEGSIGETYKGEHVLLHEPVCVKHCSRISPVAEAILIDEAKAVWDLRHYALPAMRDFLRLEDGTVALVMSYVPGPTLAQIIEKNGKLDPDHVAWIAERILNALKYLHYQGVVHGDLKPQNIIVQPKQHMAVLVDFGLAMKNSTKSSRSRGYTEYFAPPEQQARGVPLLPETDLYSLGTTMLYALSGKLDRVKARQIPAGVPDQLEDFIRELLRVEVLERPNWLKQDLCETIEKVRELSFGSKHSNMKPIPNFS